MNVLHVSSSLRDMVQAINQLIVGRNNANGTVTLTASAATTTVTPDSSNLNGVPLFTPTTANAAAELGNGTMYVSSVTKDNFVITHANNAQNDRTFKYVFLGG